MYWKLDSTLSSLIAIDNGAIIVAPNGCDGLNFECSFLLIIFENKMKKVWSSLVLRESHGGRHSTVQKTNDGHVPPKMEGRLKDLSRYITCGGEG